MKKIDLWRPLHVGGKWVWWVVELIRWPLPERAGYRAAVVLGFALLPFLPFEKVTVPELRWAGAAVAIVLALWACLDRSVAALLILSEGRQTIRAKQLGLRQDLSALKELHESPWSGLPLLLFVIMVVGCTIALAASSVTYSVINHLQIGDAFQNNSSDRVAILLFFGDEAARGMTLRLCDELGIAVPAKLQVVRYLPFALFLWVYKNVFVLLIAQAGWLAFISLFAEVEPEVKRLSDEIRRLTNLVFELRLEAMKHRREDILRRQNAHGGNLLQKDRAELKAQLDFLHGLYRPEYHEIKNALRRDDKVNGRLAPAGARSPNLERKKRRRIVGLWR